MRLSNVLINIDRRMDYVPIISTVNNFVDLVQKIAISVFSQWKERKELKNTYFNHLQNKGYWECIALSIPGINLLTAIIRPDPPKFSQAELFKNIAASSSQFQNSWRELCKKPVQDWEAEEIKKALDYSKNLQQACWNYIGNTRSARHGEEIGALQKALSKLRPWLSTYYQVVLTPRFLINGYNKEEYCNRNGSKLIAAGNKVDSLALPNLI